MSGGRGGSGADPAGDAERRARELLARELDAIRFPAMAAEIRDKDGYSTLGAAMVRVVAAALSAPKQQDLMALAQRWQDEAAASWGETKEHATLQRCCDELREAAAVAGRLEANYAECCAQGGGSPEGCDCTNKSHVRIPSVAFEEWFTAIEEGDGTIPVPQSIADGGAWHEHIGRRQIALGAWMAAIEHLQQQKLLAAPENDQ